MVIFKVFSIFILYYLGIFLNVTTYYDTLNYNLYYVVFKGCSKNVMTKYFFLIKKIRKNNHNKKRFLEIKNYKNSLIIT